MQRNIQFVIIALTVLSSEIYISCVDYIECRDVLETDYSKSNRSVKEWKYGLRTEF